MSRKICKKAQVQISFGMIFSILIIIATVAVAFYVITKFLEMSRCTQIGDFNSLLEKEINTAWRGDITQKVWVGSLPSGISNVCFGNLTQKYDRTDEKIHADLEEVSSPSNNVFLYPGGKACDIGLAYRKVAHFTTDGFFCVPVKSGKMSVMLTKGGYDPLVKLSKP